MKLKSLAGLAGAVAAIAVMGAASSSFAQSVDPSKRCLELTVSKGPSTRPEVVTSIENLIIDVPFEALGVCRAALAANPTNAELVAGEELATKVATVLALGIGYPPKREDAFAKALEASQGAGGFSEMLIAYYVASAYAYGAGAPKEPARAVLWFAKVLQTKPFGNVSTVVQAELDRVLAAAAPK